MKPYLFCLALWSGCSLAQPLTPVAPEPVLAKPAVLSLAERFADLPNFPLETPAFAPKKLDFTTEAELQQFLQRRIAPHQQMHWRTLGKTPGGRDLHLIVASQDGRGDPLAVAANRKPTVWVIGQQHGNEPAGAEAALELLRRLTAGELKSVLEKINVVVMPRANPDGAANFKRETSKGDMNRDHVHLALTETQALHAALDAYPPSVVVDAHEFTAAGRWVDRYGVAQASDILFQSSTHPAIPEGLRKMAKEVFDPALQAAWAQHGLRSFVYHTLNIQGGPQGSQAFVQMGGNFAGIARNAFGLYGAVSFLIETRGVGINKDHYPRRVASHVLSMATVLKTAAKHAEDLKALQRELRKPSAVGGDWLVDHSVRREMRALPMFDPIMGEDKAVMVEFQNSLAITPTLVRSLPLGYILPPNHPAASKLKALGLNTVRLLNPVEMELESYTVKSFGLEAGEFGAPQERLATEIKRQKRMVEAGSVWVPIASNLHHHAQPLWRLAMTVLEPEGIGSLASYKLLGELTVGVELPVHRVLATTSPIVAPLRE